MTDHGPGSVAGPAAARARMAAGLRINGRAPSERIQDAFATVPRHLFVPQISAADAYRDEAFVLKCGPDGVPLSSSSQPAMMAIMLEQLDLQPGHRVLEIGTGSGYNAAIMALVTGPDGAVTTVDIDPELVSRARASLAEAGFGDVDVICADGGFGAPEHAPFDRIIVTAGAWDIAPAWLAQLGPEGRLVLPLSVCGLELSVALEPSDGSWLSRSACRCGFVRMLGAFARPQFAIRLGGPDLVVVQVADDVPMDGVAVAAALAGDYVEIETGVRILDDSELADLDMWLTLTEPDLCRLTVLRRAGTVSREIMPVGGIAANIDDARAVGVAALVLGAPGLRGSQARVRGYGPGGEVLAGYLAGQCLTWAELGRPRADEVELRVWPQAAAPPVPPGTVMLDRPSVRIAVGWPGQGSARQDGAGQDGAGQDGAGRYWR
jgi:protein-L-isoaspartate(D-aspartate) O-methyltransferase